MSVIAIMNQKGGVGKTTLTINFAAGLALSGRKVLLIDVDLQANATIGLGLVAHQDHDMFSYLVGRSLFKQVVMHKSIKKGKKSAMLDIIPATIALSGFEQAVKSVHDKQTMLQQKISALKKEYDYIVLDCPPSLGLLSLNALVAADQVMIPVQPEFFALHGLSQLLDTVSVLQKSLNPCLMIAGIICSRVNRRKIHHEVIDCLQQRFADTLFTTRIHENIAIAEAPSFGQTIFEYQSKSQGSYDFDLLVREYIKKYDAQLTIPVAKNKMQQMNQ